jgi:hypothetical protein
VTAISAPTVAPDEHYAIDFVSGWAAVVPPVRWTGADSARLQQHLAPG